MRYFNKDELKKKVAQGKTSQVLKFLIENLDSISDRELKNNILMQSSKFENYLNEKINQTSNNDALELLLAKINKALLQLIDKLPNVIANEEKLQEKKGYIKLPLQNKPNFIKRKKYLKVGALLFFTLIVIFISLNVVNTSNIKYSFEEPKAKLIDIVAFFNNEIKDPLKGWYAQDYPGNHAIQNISRSGKISKHGDYSLTGHIRLIGGDSDYDQGEIYVNMLQSPPRKYKPPINLKDLQVSASIFIPKDVVMGDEVGGIQVFLKDEQWNSQYGPYISLDNKIEYWFDLTILPGRNYDNVSGFIDAEFDPTRIIALGIRIDGCGIKECIYEGNIFFDSFRW